MAILMGILDFSILLHKVNHPMDLVYAVNLERDENK